MAGDVHADDRVSRMGFILSLRQRGIVSPPVLRAMDEVPRERFVAVTRPSDAYGDHAMPIPCGQTISQPFVVAYMTERLKVSAEHRVLEIGTGSGYQTAILSRLAREVVSIERYRGLADDARDRLARLEFDKVAVRLGDGCLGAPDAAPFDRILVTAAAAIVPEALVEQLAEDGVMVLPLGPADGAQAIVRITKTHGELSQERLMAVRFVPLVPGAAREL